MANYFKVKLQCYDIRQGTHKEKYTEERKQEASRNQHGYHSSVYVTLPQFGSNVKHVN